MTARRDDIDGEELAQLYAEGYSQRMLAARYRCSQPTVRRLLVEQETTARSLTDAHRLRWVRDPETSLQAIRKGAETTKGRRRTPEALAAQAAAKQRSGQVKVGRAEYPLREHLASMGVEFIPQYAVDRYNLDIAVIDGDARVAVEVEDTPHYPLGASRRSKARRAEHLRDRGWSVVFVWCHNGLPPERGAAERIRAHLEAVRLDPAVSRQYLVIRRDGQDAVRAHTGRRAERQSQ